MSHLGLTWVSPGLGNLTGVSPGSHPGLGNLTGVSTVSHRCHTRVSPGLAGRSVSPEFGSHRGLTWISRGLTWVSPGSHMSLTVASGVSPSLGVCLTRVWGLTWVARGLKVSRVSSLGLQEPLFRLDLTGATHGYRVSLLGSVSPGLGSHRDLTWISRGLTWVSPGSHLSLTGVSLQSTWVPPVSHRGIGSLSGVTPGRGPTCTRAKRSPWRRYRGRFAHKQFCKMPHPCVRSSSPPCTSFSKPGHNSKIRSRSYGCACVSENTRSIKECSGYPSLAVLAMRSMGLGMALHGVWPMAGPGREGVCAEHGGGGN